MNIKILKKQFLEVPYSNLHLLITRARQWVITQFDQLCELLTKELEPMQYETLLAQEGITYTAPGVDEMHKPRNAL